MGVHEDKLTKLKRKVIRSTSNDSSRHKSRFAKAVASLSKKCGCKVQERTLYHGTSVRNGENIMQGGFKIFDNQGAFGKGVNLSPDIGHTLMYRSGEACTIVCKVAIGRIHENISREIEGKTDGSVPDHIMPKRGYDAMYGAGGLIVVVPSAERVLPVRMIVHR